jgi:starch-binding outer membrane protein, SusD/RagB family
MKNILKYTFLLALTLFTLNSCFKEYLEPVPKLNISDLSAFDTKSRIVAQINGIYNSFRSGQYLGGRFQVYNEIRADDFLNLGQNGVTGLMTWNHTLAASTNEVQNLWGQVYNAINTVNVFLEGLEAANPVTKGVLTQAEFDQYKGEALALRGLAHFNLTVLYAWPHNYNSQALGVIVRLKAQKSSADNNQGRETLAKTYEAIFADLDQAEALLPTVSGANSTSYVTRVQKSTVIALKTRIYMHTKNWAKVISEGNKIVPNTAPFNATSGVAYGLNSSYTNIFRSPFTTSESVFSMPFNATELPGTQNQMGYYFSPSPVGNNEYPINQTSVNWTNTEFPVTDARRLLTATSAGNLYLNKYTGLSDWVPVIRWAEVLLNIAEAEAMTTGVTARAVAILNAVYLRSNPTATAFTTADFANGSALVARILRERRMEFLGEGLTSMDIVRTLRTFGAKSNVDAIPVNSLRYVWPIPQTELNTNSLVEQNNTIPNPQ